MDQFWNPDTDYDNYNTFNDINYQLDNNRDTTFDNVDPAIATQNFAAPAQRVTSVQQSRPASRAASTVFENPTYQWRADIGFFVPTPYPTYTRDPEIGYYTKIPNPPGIVDNRTRTTAAQAQQFPSPAPVAQGYQQIPPPPAPMAQGYTDPTIASCFMSTPYVNNANLQLNDSADDDDDYDYQEVEAGPSKPRKQHTSFPKQSVSQHKRPKHSSKAKAPRRPAYHKNSIVSKCVCSAVEHVPRPPNAFIIFRSQVSFPEDIKDLMTNEERVRMIGGHKLDIRQASRLWTHISEKQQQRYKKQAKRLKNEHASKYPNYKYQPKEDLARDFGNEGCTCGAYAINIEARKTRAQRNSHDDGQEDRPKAFGSRRHASTKEGGYQVNLDVDVDAESELSDAPDEIYEPANISNNMHLSADQRIAAASQFADMRSRASAERRANSRRPARAAAQSMNYADTDLFDNDRTDTRPTVPSQQRRQQPPSRSSDEILRAQLQQYNTAHPARTSAAHRRHSNSNNNDNNNNNNPSQPAPQTHPTSIAPAPATPHQRIPNPSQNPFPSPQSLSKPTPAPEAVDPVDLIDDTWIPLENLDDLGIFDAFTNVEYGYGLDMDHDGLFAGTRTSAENRGSAERKRARRMVRISAKRASVESGGDSGRADGERRGSSAERRRMARARLVLPVRRH